MRLTLRTLLAYLDGILEPNDAQDLGKKIEDSEFATDLVHRIRDVMRRLRLSAPDVANHSLRLDPNTVAEYLDNTLDAEGVTEFEKVCLESDVALSEVASCHQILTLVLGEPAEIDPATRQRMYQVPEPQVSLAPPVVSNAEPPFVTTSVVLPPSLEPGPEDGQRGERKSRPRPTVPEYLREPRKSRRWIPMATALVVAAAMLVVVLNLFGQFEPGTPLGDMLVRGGLIEPPRELAAQPEGKARGAGEERRGATELPPSQPAAQPPKQPAKQPAAETTAEKTPEKETGKAVAVPMPKETAKSPVPPPPGPAKEPVKSPAAETAVKPETPAKESTAGAAKEATKTQAGAMVARPPEPNPPPAPTVKTEPAAVTPPAESQKTAGPKPPAETAGETTSPAAKPVAPLPPDLASTVPGAPGKSSTPKVTGSPESPESLGRLMSADQLLVGKNAAGGWVRVAANQRLMPQRLLALPTYRAHVTLTVGVTLEILGGTALDLLASSPTEMPGIGIRYGRVVMMPLAKAGSRVRVLFGGRGGVIIFPDAESVAALEVRHVHPPGANPEAGPLHVVADLYASAGGVTWEELGDTQGTKTRRLTAPQWVSFNGALTSTPATSNDLPGWITAERIGMLDRRASLALAKELPTDRLARVGLQELNASRPQKEVKWLALRCLGYLGAFRDMVAALNDPARRLEWPEYVDQLREAVARDAESAAAVREALENQYPQQAALLYRMLWGYSDKDLQDGADKTLVGALDDETLAVRVLSFRTLHESTGLGLFYQPEQTAAKRLQPTVRWRQRLKAGEIRLKTPEEKAGAAAEERAPPVPAPLEK